MSASWFDPSSWGGNGSVMIGDPGSQYNDMQPIAPTYDYSTPSYNYTNTDSTAFDQNGNYPTASTDTGLYGPTPQGGNVDSGTVYGPTPGGGNIDSGAGTYNDQGLYGPTPQGGNIDSGTLYGPTPNGGNISNGGQGTYGQQATGPVMPGQQGTGQQQTGYGQPQRAGQQQQQGQQSLLQKAIGAVTGTGGGTGTGGSSSGSLMDSLVPMLLAGGAGYLLSNLIGSKSSSGSAPGGSIGAFGVNQAALSPSKALNIPTGGTRASSQPAWGNPGAPSAQSLGFNAPGTSTLGQLAGMSSQAPMNYNFQNTMQTPQLPAPQMSASQLSAPQTQLSAMHMGTPTPTKDIGFETNPIQQTPMLAPQPVAPMDINNVNFGATSVPGYTPPAGAPVAPNQINDFLKSLMG